ncbi:MAG: hypothetical protein V4586_05945 [Pseudomonadota bacterium]
MNLADFETELIATVDENTLLNFCRRTVLHGTPFVFSAREPDHFSFKQRIANKYNINHTEVYIVGSAKLGFSPHKKTDFSLDSDIDIAIVSHQLANYLSDLGLELEYGIRSSQINFRHKEWNDYHNYLRYGAMGWIRPDLIPTKQPMQNFKNEWFDFFKSISHDKSEVGNYSVTAGIFRSVLHLEKYTTNSLRKIKNQMEVAARA